MHLRLIPILCLRTKLFFFYKQKKLDKNCYGILEGYVWEEILWLNEQNIQEVNLKTEQLEKNILCFSKVGRNWDGSNCLVTIPNSSQQS